jgi:hypothetical protein
MGFYHGFHVCIFLTFYEVTHCAFRLLLKLLSVFRFFIGDGFECHAAPLFVEIRNCYEEILDCRKNQFFRVLRLFYILTLSI